MADEKFEKARVEHDGNLTKVFLRPHNGVNAAGVILNRLEAEGLRWRLVPPEGKQRREIGTLQEGDESTGDSFFRLYGLRAGHVLTPKDIADLQSVLNDCNDQIEDLANAVQRGKLLAYQELGGDALVDAAEQEREALSDACVAQAMLKLQEATARHHAKKDAAELARAVLLVDDGARKIRKPKPIWASSRRD